MLSNSTQMIYIFEKYEYFTKINKFGTAKPNKENNEKNLRGC